MLQEQQQLAEQSVPSCQVFATQGQGVGATGFRTAEQHSPCSSGQTGSGLPASWMRGWHPIGRAAAIVTPLSKMAGRCPTAAWQPDSPWAATH